MTALFGLEPWAFAGLLASFLAGGLVKGMLGFGLPLVVVSLAVFIVDLEVFLAANALVMPFSNALQVRQAGPMMPVIRRFRALLLALALTLPPGIWLAGAAAPETMMLILGLVVMLFTALQGASPRLVVPRRLERAAGVAAGAIGGLVGGVTTVNGPVVTLFCVGLALERRAMIALQGLAFLLTGVVLSVGYAGIGVIDGPRALTGLACILPAWAGMRAGNRLAGRLPTAIFRRVVLAALFVAGANLVWRALGG